MTMVRFSIFVAGLAVLRTCLALPVQEIAEIKRDVEGVNDEYDYVVIGGGTAGLSVADRLSEDGSSKSILSSCSPKSIFRINNSQRLS